jgi:uncharacterized protein
MSNLRMRGCFVKLELSRTMIRISIHAQDPKCLIENSEQPMSSANHQIVREYFTGLSSGNLPDTLFTPDMTVWTTTSGTSPGKKYLGGVKLLQSLFKGGLLYTIDSLTAEGDRVAAEVQARGTLLDGQDYHNTYVFMFRIRDGRIAAVAEHFNPAPVREKLGPLMQAAMAKAAH